MLVEGDDHNEPIADAVRGRSVVVTVFWQMPGETEKHKHLMTAQIGKNRAHPGQMPPQLDDCGGIGRHQLVPRHLAELRPPRCDNNCGAPMQLLNTQQLKTRDWFWRANATPRSLWIAARRLLGRPVSARAST